MFASFKPSHPVTASDQFCSLVYPISNLYFMGCVYTRSRHFSAYESNAGEVWSMCGIAHNWIWYFLLGMLPYLARFLHSLRRYRDSKLPGQLVNVRHLDYLHSFYVHHHFRIGWEVRDGGDTIPHLLLLEAPKYA